MYNSYMGRCNGLSFQTRCHGFESHTPYFAGLAQVVEHKSKITIAFIAHYLKAG